MIRSCRARAARRCAACSISTNATRRSRCYRRGSLAAITLIQSLPGRCTMTPSRDISRLIEIMAALRTPVTGCPWDVEQTFETIAPYAIEEAHEVVDAITRGDLDDLREELGDLLLQVVYHAQIAEEQNAFAFGDVVQAITAKMIRRHPHVFPDKDGKVTKPTKGTWDRIKAEEKAE